MGFTMTYLRLTPQEGADPVRTAHSVFGDGSWRERHADDHILDLAELWQALHYLITGDPWEGDRPVADAVCGGRLVTDDDTMRAELGVDVVYLEEGRVKLAADSLADLPFSKVAKRYDAARMAELEVQKADEWVGKPVKGIRDSQLRPAYDKLVAFFGAAAGSGQAIYKTMG